MQDTGISVRKRVIKIFRDVCVEMPNFEKIPDMCVKMIRRVNDEDGIKVKAAAANRQCVLSLMHTVFWCHEVYYILYFGTLYIAYEIILSLALLRG